MQICFVTRKQYHSDEGALAGTRNSRIFAHCNVLGADVQKATTMRLNAILFLLHCGAKPPDCGLILAFFSLSCNWGAISVNRVALYIESEKYAVSSPPLKLPDSELPVYSLMADS